MCASCHLKVFKGFDCDIDFPPDTLFVTASSKMEGKIWALSVVLFQFYLPVSSEHHLIPIQPFQMSTPTDFLCLNKIYGTGSKSLLTCLTEKEDESKPSIFVLLQEPRNTRPKRNCRPEPREEVDVQFAYA